MILERDIEVGRLKSLADEAYKSRGAIALIAGEAGIGKTSLISAFVKQEEKNADIAWGLCDAMFTPRPLGPVYEIAQMISGELEKLAFDRAKGEILFPAIFSHLNVISTPVIIVIEDLHWADHGTLDFLRFLGRRISTLPVLLVASFRDDEVGPDHPLSQVLGELPAQHTHRIKLSPLGLDSIQRLAQNTDIAPKDVLKVTGGNPFFVTELLAAQDMDKKSVPASVKEAVNARLSRVSALERQFLEFVSCIPGAINVDLIESVFDDEAEMLALACVGRGLLKRNQEGKLRFRHELARLATYARVPSTQKRAIHGKMLDLLLGLDSPDIDQIVHHAAGALNSEAVLKYAPQAAQHAAEVGSHREAAGHLSTALEFVNEADPELAATLYENWAYEAALALRIDETVIEARRHAITLWRALGRKDKVAENLRRLARLHWYLGEAGKAARLSDEAVNLFENEGPSHEKAMAYSLRSQLHMLNDRMDQAIAWGNKALEVVATTNDHEVRIHALNNIGSAKLFRGNRDGLKDMEESLMLALETHRHEDAARVYTNLAEYAVIFKDFELAEKVIAEGIAFDTKHDLDSWTYYLIGRSAQLRLEQGRLVEAENISKGVLERRGQTLLMKLPAKIMHAKACLRLGRPNAASLLADALQDAAATAEMQYSVPVRIAFLEQAATLGPISMAPENFQKMLELPKSAMNQWHWAEFWFWSNQCGLTVPDARLPELPEPYQYIADGDPVSAARSFENLGMNYFAAWSYYLDASEDSLNKALILSTKMESQYLTQLIKELAHEKQVDLQSIRSSRGPYRASRSHPLGLTKKEQEVLALLVKGHGNKDIADKLSRSKRTVENHVSSLLTKFNARSRMDVILRVHNEPWLIQKSA